MSPAATPEDSSSGPAGEDDEPRARAERRLRLQSLAGMTVLGSDGRTVGRVRDIYQQDDSGELAAITVMPRQLSSRTVLIPSAAIAALPAERPEGSAGQGADDEGAADGADAARGTARADATAADGAASADAGAASGPADSAGAAARAADSRPADVVRLHIEAAVARAGLRPPETGHATVELLREAAAALDLRTGGHVEA